jgi:hypothetical protein
MLQLLCRPEAVKCEREKVFFFLFKSSKSFLPLEDAFLNAVRAITAFGNSIGRK